MKKRHILPMIRARRWHLVSANAVLVQKTNQLMCQSLELLILISVMNDSMDNLNRTQEKYTLVGIYQRYPWISV